MLILQKNSESLQPIRTPYRDLLFYDKNHKHKKLHVTTFLPPSLARVSFRGTLPLIMVQWKRGFKFTLSEIESLLEVVEAIIPIENPDWDKILNSLSAMDGHDHPL